MPFRQQTIKQAFMLLSLFAILLAGCADMSPILSKQTAVPPTNQMLTPSQTYELKSRLPTETHLPTESPALPTSTQISEPKGCREPQGNYDRIVINGHQLNQRTYEMLTYAAEIYKGIIDITGEAITQGSYTGAVEASFGTHSGGGAVDLCDWLALLPGTGILTNFILALPFTSMPLLLATGNCPCQPENN